jgi:O-antigen ligase
MLRNLLLRSFHLSRTPLDRAVLFYLGLLLVRFLFDRSGLVAWWGLYISAMYLPLFWLVPAVLHQRPTWMRRMVILLVIVGAVVALGGLVEFLVDVALWPSEETIVRQGYADYYVYDTQVRRVYFVFDSPTTLANTLAMILPLALALFATADGRRNRLFYGFAAVLIAGCIVVTFSRGIWVATILALVFMAFLAWKIYASNLQNDKPSRKQRFAYLFAPASLVLIFVIWMIFTALRSQGEAYSGQFVAELSPEAYYSAPVTTVHASLLDEDPIYGDRIIQEWNIFDPILGMDDYRNVLYSHPIEGMKTEIIYQVEVPVSPALQLAIALSPEVWSPDKGDGVRFQVYVADSSTPQDGQFLFQRYINPKSNPSDRRWRNYLIDLSKWNGQTVNLSLITEAGPAGDWNYDWAGWAELNLVTLEANYFETVVGSENVFLRHLGSITDWVHDETNRDRLAAWNLGLHAWRESALWGQGLGTTGVAALRTQPETAFVTESQVLKALTELGILGLIALGYLWFNIGKVGLAAYRKTTHLNNRWLLLGLLTSLVVVFIEGWIYQNLEVKQVNAYFWTIVGMVAYLAKSNDD